ncbi:hypothetical protein EV421DRAFT_1737800 [Armillaria borealis]|uniref:Uncharacterized protein n=1 Tax=Armillaria borealis TaxID=47425 RepID=A0AA39MMY3_9AGAR|nr:hypothetical protein EV421DRAFT_1737800 [Armillaria borealis]
MIITGKPVPQELVNHFVALACFDDLSTCLHSALVSKDFFHPARQVAFKEVFVNFDAVENHEGGRTEEGIRVWHPIDSAIVFFSDPSRSDVRDLPFAPSSSLALFNVEVRHLYWYNSVTMSVGSHCEVSGGEDGVGVNEEGIVVDLPISTASTFGMVRSLKVLAVHFHALRDEDVDTLSRWLSTTLYLEALFVKWIAMPGHSERHESMCMALKMFTGLANALLDVASIDEDSGSEMRVKVTVIHPGDFDWAVTKYKGGLDYCNRIESTCFQKVGEVLKGRFMTLEHVGSQCPRIKLRYQQNGVRAFTVHQRNKKWKKDITIPSPHQANATRPTLRDPPENKHTVA